MEDYYRRVILLNLFHRNVVICNIVAQFAHDCNKMKVNLAK